MRRLFIQFYLLLIGCFGLAILLIGLVYQVSAERAGDRYLEHMMQGSLGLLTGEQIDAILTNDNFVKPHYRGRLYGADERGLPDDARNYARHKA